MPIQVCDVGIAFLVLYCCGQYADGFVAIGVVLIQKARYAVVTAILSNPNVLTVLGGFGFDLVFKGGQQAIAKVAKDRIESGVQLEITGWAPK